MSNDASGVLKVVAKNKNTIERILKILNYKDDEYCLYRCKYATKNGKAFKDGKFWVQDINIDGAWSCQPFCNYGNRPKQKLVLDYKKNKDGSTSKRKIYGSAHFTDLSYLAKKLDFGCELWASEPGCCFAEHILVGSNGENFYEHESYELVYPEGKDGEPDYDAEPEEDCGFGDEFMQFANSEDIYGFVE